MQVFLDSEKFELSPELLELVQKTLALVAQTHQLADNTSVSVTFVEPAEIKEINLAYRSVDAVTDVISFALDEGEEPEIIQGQAEHLLGEIIICPARAKEQAAEYGHSLARELCYLCTHGMLHLLGYDHLNTDDQAEMRKAEEKIMGLLKLER